MLIFSRKRRVKEPSQKKTPIRFLHHYHPILRRFSKNVSKVNEEYNSPKSVKWNSILLSLATLAANNGLSNLYPLMAPPEQTVWRAGEEGTFVLHDSKNSSPPRAVNKEWDKTTTNPKKPQTDPCYTFPVLRPNIPNQPFVPYPNQVFQTNQPERKTPKLIWKQNFKPFQNIIDQPGKLRIPLSISATYTNERGKTQNFRASREVLIDKSEFLPASLTTIKPSLPANEEDISLHNIETKTPPKEESIGTSKSHSASPVDLKPAKPKPVVSIPTPTVSPEPPVYNKIKPTKKPFLKPILRQPTKTTGTVNPPFTSVPVAFVPIGRLNFPLNDSIQPPLSSTVLPSQNTSVHLYICLGVAFLVVGGIIFGTVLYKRTSSSTKSQPLSGFLLCEHGLHQCSCRHCSSCTLNAHTCSCPCHAFPLSSNSEAPIQEISFQFSPTIP